TKNKPQTLTQSEYNLTPVRQGQQTIFSQRLLAASPAVVITLVFLTLLAVLVVIGIYLYRNQGSYRTYEQPEPDTAPRDEAPPKDKEEYFI
uniref:Small cell adhesion glycoprotein n=1 Tax=Catharus ustulatus TaxID=91951 RepID=A0A8C3UWZ0_CATUS